MAESGKAFQMYHYKQMTKESADSEDSFMRATCLKRDTQDPMLKRLGDSATSKYRKDPYPWLDVDDPRRFQSDEEILYEKIDLSRSALTRKEKSKLMKMIIRYREAFSLRDEIGNCPNLKADIKVIDESPFFVRPFPLSEGDKPFMDKQMERLVALGILSKNSTSHTSPVMLITRKLTQDKRPVVDFRLLNTRILRRNTSIPLMSDVLSILGNSACEVVSCVDVKDAYHSVKLTEKSKEYCGILPYFGSPIYRYEVLPMGIACAPQIWMDYITLILGELEDKKKYIAIMDDLLIHSTKAAHWKLFEQLLQSMCKNGLRLSPKKCQLFQTKLTYMGNEFSINKRTMTVTPLRTRTEAIAKIPTPRTPKQCKSFCGVVNYLSLFCKDLQKLLKPIVELTRKGRPFIWGKEQEKAFQEVKDQLARPPVLHLPKADGRFILYADTSVEGTGSSLWQIQEGKAKLIGYASKTLPEACSRYSVTELEMTGLLVNMNLWKNLLKHREFDAAVDHVAVKQIMKAKTEPASTRIMRLLDRLSAYSFNLYYVKGRDMILSDYLSRHRQRDLDPSELIPISFCSMQIYSRLIADKVGEGIFCVQTPTNDDFILPPPLESLVDKENLVHKFIPKQGDIDKLISKINKKVLRDTNLCIDLRDLKAAYLTSPHFRDIYLYLLQNKMPLGKGAIRRIESNSRNYILLDGLLFKITQDDNGNMDTVLCIPSSKVDILLNAYHSSILGGHTGITKCYHTISQRFYCPNLAESLRAYITGCHICQMFKKGKQFKRPYQKRFNINVPAMSKVSMDIKQMPVNRGYSHILVLLCEVTNFMVALPLASTRTPHILEAFQKGYLAYFGPPTHIVCDQDPAFTSSLMEAFVTQLNIKVILVSPTNHQSLQAEHGIKSLSGLLVKHL